MIRDNLLNQEFNKAMTLQEAQEWTSKANMEY